MTLFILYIIIGSLVFTTTLIMTIWFKTNRILNFYLLLLAFVLSLYLVLFGLQHLFDFKDSCLFLNYSQVILTLLPAVFLFFEKLMHNIKFPEKKDLRFFIIPVILFSIISGNFKSKFFAVLYFGFFIFYLTFYLILIVRLLSNKTGELKQINHYSDVLINWISFIYKMMLTVMLHFLIFITSQLFGFGEELKFLLDSTFLTVFLIGYLKIIMTPELLYGNALEKSILTELEEEGTIPNVWTFELNKKINSKKDVVLSKKVTTHVKEYIEIIEKISINNFSFRDRYYSLSRLSSQSGIPKCHIEYIFKYHCNLNFDAYKRLVRVYDAKQLIKLGYLKNNTLLTLSEFVGFSSYNPFFSSFKQIVGVSPVDFSKDRHEDKAVQNKLDTTE